MNESTNPGDLAEYWQEQVDCWKRSGMSGAKFCEANQLIYHRFVYWRQKFTAGDGEQAVQLPSAGFASVRFSSAEDAGLTVSLPNGVVVRGICASNVSVVRQLLDNL